MKSKYSDKLPGTVRLYIDLDSFWIMIKHKFGSYDERRAFLASEFVGILDYIEAKEDSISLSVDLKEIEIGTAIDSSYVLETWDKAKKRLETDPEAAITSARTLLETVLKHLSEKLEISISGGDLPKMYKEISKEMKLSPDQHSDSELKNILRGCVGVTGGLAALRNAQGDCHGKSSKYYKPAVRHARLCVNMSGSMAMFLIETYAEMNKK